MKSIKVNADYESVLFNNKSLPAINESLEFLALFLNQRPLLSHKKYTGPYFDHVESFTGHRPKVVSEGAFENWWGPLQNIPLEQKLNSKEMSTSLNPDSYLLSSLKDLPKIENRTFLAKNPYGMSGQNFSLVEKERLENLEIMLRKGKVILEPLFDRAYDFSHYVFPNLTKICYQNIVDKRFQYRGTIFKDYTNPSLENLNFFPKVEKSGWKSFENNLKEIISTFHTPELSCGFSIDSFIYRDQGTFRIRAMSEVNYRRTMGLVAFELSIKFGGLKKWSALLLSKSTGMDFLILKKKLLPLEWEADTSRGIILLSPGDTRYDMFFLSAMDEQEGMILINELKDLLPESEFTIEL